MRIRRLGRKAPRSIRTKLITLVLLLTLPIILMLLFSNMYAIRVVRTQVAESYSHLMNVYIVQADDQMEAIRRTVNNLVALDANVLTMERAPEGADSTYQLAKIQLLGTLVEQAGRLNMTGAFFVYHEQRDDYFETSTEKNLTYAYRERIKSFISGALKSRENGGLPEREWVIRELDGTYHLFYVLKSGYLYLGARIPAESLMLPADLNEPGRKGGALYATGSGEIMTIAGNAGQDWSHLVRSHFAEGGARGYLVLDKPSSLGDFRLLVFIPEEDILQNLPSLQRIYWLVLLASFILIPFGLYYLRRTILVPLQRIVSTMKKVENVDLSARIEPYPTSLEFHLVNETFNRMIDQIEDLKINVYEEKLSKQREELHRLQLQINPHFFMNALNMLHSLAKARQTDVVMELAMCLIQHFRFIIRNGRSPIVQLKDELVHCRNYLRIQELRYPGRMTWSLDVPAYLQDARIPPMSVQTFIENSIKHGMTLDDPIHITVRADLAEFRSEPCIRIDIEDNGPGFPEDVLRTLQEGGSLATEDGEHLGIWNVQRRMSLLYPGQCAIRFANRVPSGARVEMIFPVYLMERGA